MKRSLIGYLAVALLGLLSVIGSTANAAPNKVEVEKLSDGYRLVADGEPILVKGMNWDYFPIGTNYSYSLWTQPDDKIRAALARDMPLMQAMGCNAIRQYNGVPPRWVKYIYEEYGIWTVLNHPMARYGYTIDGVWIPAVDYSDPKLRNAVKTEIVELVKEFEDTPGVLMWLLGNENNYGLHWSSFEIEALPEGQRDAARATHLYTLFAEVCDAIKGEDMDRPVAICNGDLQYIDIIQETCEGIDILGTNTYRGISVRDMFAEVEEKLGVPVLFTEFGADAYNARDAAEDQASQARYLIGQWEEIYEQTQGKGRVGNSLGGLVFQWTDGWWKYLQDTNLDVHDNNASWPNGGYADDFVEGSNNMNEEWWGITAKGPNDSRGLYDVYPRAAYYALSDAWELDAYDPAVDLAAVKKHFSTISAQKGLATARGQSASLEMAELGKVRLKNLRIEASMISTGGERISTPENPVTDAGYPAFQGIDQMQSVFAEIEARPTGNVRGTMSFNLLGNVPNNTIDEIFYENYGRPRTIGSEQVSELDKVRLYQSEVFWQDDLFSMHAFYRTGHYHWGYEGDFFGLYREAFYGPNVDIYNGVAPVGVEFIGKKRFAGWKVAFGPELWWGANPAIMVKNERRLFGWNASAVFQEDFKRTQTGINSTFAIPVPESRKATFAVNKRVRGVKVELGGIWSGSPRVGEKFTVTDRSNGGEVYLDDEVKESDALGGKAKLSWSSGRWNLYAQGAYMGVVAEGGPTRVQTFTGWTLLDSGSGNQGNVLGGVALKLGKFEIAPNVIWQRPLAAPVYSDRGAYFRPRNVLEDPFAVRGNRETLGAELLLSYDPTPATWLWHWDSVAREDARFASALRLVYLDHKTPADASIGVLGNGVPFAFSTSTPARELFEARWMVVSKLNHRAGLAAEIFGGNAEPNGDDPRLVKRFGMRGRLHWGRMAYEVAALVNDFGPYDYHRDFNLTYPLQFIADFSRSVGTPNWFGEPSTRIGIRGIFRTLDKYSPRYCPDTIAAPGGGLACDPEAPGDDGQEWEIRSYLSLSL